MRGSPPSAPKRQKRRWEGNTGLTGKRVGRIPRARFTNIGSSAEKALPTSCTLFAGPLSSFFSFFSLSYTSHLIRISSICGCSQLSLNYPFALHTSFFHTSFLPTGSLLYSSTLRKQIKVARNGIPFFPDADLVAELCSSVANADLFSKKKERKKETCSLALLCCSPACLPACCCCCYCICQPYMLQLLHGTIE